MEANVSNGIVATFLQEAEEYLCWLVFLATTFYLELRPSGSLVCAELSAPPGEESRAEKTNPVPQMGQVWLWLVTAKSVWRPQSLMNRRVPAAPRSPISPVGGNR